MNTIILLIQYCWLLCSVFGVSAMINLGIRRNLKEQPTIYPIIFLACIDLLLFSLMFFAPIGIVFPFIDYGSYSVEKPYISQANPIILQQIVGFYGGLSFLLIIKLCWCVFFLKCIKYECLFYALWSVAIILGVFLFRAWDILMIFWISPWG